MKNVTPPATGANNFPVMTFAPNIPRVMRPRALYGFLQLSKVAGERAFALCTVDKVYLLVVFSSLNTAVLLIGVFALAVNSLLLFVPFPPALFIARHLAVTLILFFFISCNVMAGAWLT